MQNADDPASRRRTRVRRLRWLVAWHALLAVAPSAFCLVPPDIRFLPLIWALSSVGIGQMMLLSFWAGAGVGQVGWRFVSTSVGCAYLATWPALGSTLSRAATESVSFADYAHEFRNSIVACCTVVLILTLAFLIVRRWFSELRQVSDTETLPRGRLQYSILNLLVTMTVAALLLGLMRIAYPASGSDWRGIAATILMAACFVIDALCAVWAALATGRIRWRIFLVLLVSALLGFLVSISGGSGAVAWWLVPSWILTSLLPIAIMIASLFVVRGCGYRLVPKPE